MSKISDIEKYSEIMDFVEQTKIDDLYLFIADYKKIANDKHLVEREILYGNQPLFTLLKRNKKIVEFIRSFNGDFINFNDFLTLLISFANTKDKLERYKYVLQYLKELEIDTIALAHDTHPTVSLSNISGGKTVICLNREYVDEDLTTLTKYYNPGIPSYCLLDDHFSCIDKNTNTVVLNAVPIPVYFEGKRDWNIRFSKDERETSKTIHLHRNNPLDIIIEELPSKQELNSMVIPATLKLSIKRYVKENRK